MILWSDSNILIVLSWSANRTYLSYNYESKKTEKYSYKYISTIIIITENLKIQLTIII